MIYRIRKKDRLLKGNIHLTPSKSISNRLLVIRALCTEKFDIIHPATANDTILLKKLLDSPLGIIDAEDAGTVFRFLTAYLSQKPGAWLLTGTGRMKQRPIRILVEALRKLGAEISYAEKDNYPPLKIVGKELCGGEIEMDGSVSSQFVSALLMIAPTLENGLQLKLAGEVFSKSYIEMTLKLMKEFHIDYEWRDNIISVQHQSYHPKNISVESDWSAASYWYEMAAFADEVDLVITGLQQHSIQGDCVIAELMKLFGVETEFTNTGIRLIKTSTSLLPKEFSFDFQNCPDLVPAMAVTCSGIGVEASFTGVKNLRIKETDRLNALKNELEKAGTSCEISENDFRIHGYKKYFVPTSFFQTYHDHRMAMSLAPLALKFKKVEIENPGVVRKSYPEFWEDLRTVGFEISEDQN